MEKNMETTIVYWGYIGGYRGIVEKKMETTIVLLCSRRAEAAAHVLALHSAPVNWKKSLLLISSLPAC